MTKPEKPKEPQFEDYGRWDTYFSGKGEWKKWQAYHDAKMREVLERLMNDVRYGCNPEVRIEAELAKLEQGDE